MPLQALADVAPTLKEAELRVLLELARRQLTAGTVVRASSRDLATACKASRRNVQYALDSLTKRGLITTRQGNTKTPAIYQVNFLQTVRIGGVVPTPPPWRRDDATLALFQHQPGVETTPPPNDSKALAPAAGALDVSMLLPPILDRVLKSKVSDFDKTTVDYFRRALHSYMAKFGRDDDNRRYLDAGAAPHPPDNDVVARFLSTAETHQLMPLIETLSWEAERDDKLQPHSYGWFVTVALSRLAGIHWTATKKAEQQFRIHKRGQRQAPTTPAPPAQPGELFAPGDFIAAAVVGVKNIR